MKIFNGEKLNLEVEIYGHLRHPPTPNKSTFLEVPTIILVWELTNAHTRDVAMSNSHLFLEACVNKRNGRG